MAKTKAFYGNQYVENEGFVKRWGRRIKKAIIVSGCISVSIWLIMGGIYYGKTTAKPVIVEAQVKVEVPVEMNAPILDRIMKCESANSQKNKSGQVTIHINNDGSYDIGKMQINSTWNSTATKLGYDLTKEADNIAFGHYLFSNYGSEPWKSSRSCWSR